MSRIAWSPAMVSTLVLSLCAPVWAFNPPVDKVGPLTVSIDGPQTADKLGVPLPVHVKLESTADTPLSGTVRVGLIDGWTVQPEKAVPFQLAAKGTQTLDFSIVARADAFNALYPIHAFVSFENQGQTQAAHAVLVTTVKNAHPPQPAPPPDAWKPFELRDGVALRRLPVRRVIVNVFGREPLVMPIGWQGTEPESLTHCVFDARTERGGPTIDTIAMHPPYHQGPGTVAVQYPVKLPADQPARLRYAMAIRDNDTAHNEPSSDGVTFRVRVMPFSTDVKLADGEIVREHHTAAKKWESAEVDLSRYAGQAVIIQLESDPGPKKDTTCDLCFWGEPILSVGQAGSTDGLGQPTFPPTAQAEPLGAVGVTMPRWNVRIWPGKRGLLDATFGFDNGQKQLFFHGLHVRINGDDLAEASAVHQLVKFTNRAQPPTHEYTHTFRTPAGEEFDVVVAISTGGAGLQIKVNLQRTPPPQPWRVTIMDDVSLGPWSETAPLIYAGQGNVMRDPQPFELHYDGHQLSTSFVGFDFANGVSLVQAVDVVPNNLTVNPSAKLYSLHTSHTQTITLIPAANVWQGVKAWHDMNGLKPAGGVEKLAGRFVFDCWGGRYAGATQQLQRAYAYGLSRCVLVWHNWQRHGYDNRLPDIWPPNPDMGTLDEFKTLAAWCKGNGIPFAPHDNYIDYYPDAEGFSYEHIAFTWNREPVKAWFNPGPQAQSYRWRADRVRPFVERNLKLIRDGVAPTAFFIDVWSSIQPYDYWTHDGQFHDRQTTTKTWGELFSWIRDYLGDNAPQISESGHDALIGHLDGSQTNHLRVGPPKGEGSDRWFVWDVHCADAERIPWFDAAHHDRFVQHGAGYDPRYRAGLDAKTHGIYSDDYIATEVLTAHPAMVDRPFGRDVVRKYWLLEELMRRLALAKFDSLDFDNGNIHRQHVRWQCHFGSADVWVNRGQDNWQVAGHTLPEYGWYARVQDGSVLFEAAVERLNGRTIEWAGRDVGSCYVNPRTTTTNPQPVTFGAITTDGAFRFAALNSDGSLTITPLPDEPTRTIRIDLKAAGVGSSKWKTVHAVNETNDAGKTSPVTIEGNTLILRTEPGVFAYHLVP